MTYGLPDKNPDRLDRLVTIIRLLGDVPEPHGLDALVILLAHRDHFWGGR